MSRLSKNSLITTSIQLALVKRVALVLPIAVAAGCAGNHSRDIIDYTVSEAEYIALTTPAEPPREMIAAAEKKPAPVAPVAPQIPTIPAPVVAAAKPAAVVAAKPQPVKPAPLPALTKPAMVEKAEPELAAAFDLYKQGFTPGVYAGAGLGVSRINPDVSAAPSFSTADNVAPAGQVTLGVDVLKNLSVELHSADYGSTALSPEGRVNFHVNGVSALLYAGKAAGRYRRNGWNGYARIGYNEIENTPVGNVPFIEQSSARGSFGLGVEYNTRRGLGFRADAIAYDGDVQYGQLGMLYRVGKKPKRPALAKAPALPAKPVIEAPAAPAPEPLLQAAKPKPKAAKVTASKAEKAESDIRLKRFEALTSTKPDTVIDECTRLNGTINDVTFHNGSATLTRAASRELNGIAHTLNGCADRQVVVTAHTDNSGSAFANDRLSKMRARTVALYLGRRGVSMDRMSAVAYGESRPVASNATADGRMRNRRVELEVR